MTHKNTVGTLMAALLVLVVGLACSGLKDDTEVANKLIDEGNASITESTTLLTDAATKLEALGDIKNLSQAPKLAPELIRVLDQAQEKCKTAAAKFDEASKLKVDDKFKEYLVTKVKEFNKRAELVQALKGIPEAYSDLKGIEGAFDRKRLDSFKAKTTAANDKADSLRKEASDLADQATKIQQDNPTIFKSST